VKNKNPSFHSETAERYILGLFKNTSALNSRYKDRPTPRSEVKYYTCFDLGYVLRVRALKNSYKTFS